MISITMYQNAQFNPIDMRYVFKKLSSINSSNNCLCQCFNHTLCFTATYFGINRTCLLTFAQLSQGQMQVVPTNINATVFTIRNRTLQGKYEKQDNIIICNY